MKIKFTINDSHNWGEDTHNASIRVAVGGDQPREIAAVTFDETDFIKGKIRAHQWASRVLSAALAQVIEMTEPIDP